MVWEYCTKEDVEKYSGFSSSRLEDSWSEWVESLMEERLGKIFTGTTQYTETYDGDGTDILLLDKVPLVSVSALSIDSVGANASEYKVYTAGYIRLVHTAGSAIEEAIGSTSATFPVGQKNISITYTAGEAAVPAYVEMAAAMAISQIALISERAGVEGSLSMSMASGRRAGETDRASWKLDCTARVLKILDQLIGRKWKFA